MTCDSGIIISAFDIHQDHRLLRPYILLLSDVWQSGS